MSLRHLLLNAAVAALYAALTIALAPVSYGPIQIRLSECMTLLAFYGGHWIPGLVAGCFLANLGSPFGLTDILVGTFATFISVYTMRFCRNLFTAALCPVIANGILIGAELLYLAEIPADPVSVILTPVYIAAGEFVAVGIVGPVLFRILLKNPVIESYIK